MGPNLTKPKSLTVAKKGYLAKRCWGSKGLHPKEYDKRLLKDLKVEFDTVLNDKTVCIKVSFKRKKYNKIYFMRKVLVKEFKKKSKIDHKSSSSNLKSCKAECLIEHVPKII